MQYIRQLDTIRAFAVFLVIIHHWFPQDSMLHILPTGPMGVDIFFVLSGFLISAILLRQRNGATTALAIKSFYWRRALRIFPIYYLAILMLLIFQQYVNSDIPAAFPYLATYTSNFYFFDRGAWDGAISHLWSLAVEEQFYLIWPWVLLLVPQRWLLHCIVLFILMGAGSQLLMQNWALHSILPFACFDAFGVGALLAWTLQYKPQKMHRFYQATIVAGLAGAIGSVCHLYLGLPLLPLRTANALMALWLITYAVTRGEQVRARFLWNNSALIFFGKISYGLYLYHLLVSQVLQPKLVQPLLHPLLPNLLTTRHSGLLILAENTALLLVLSILSYYLIEVKFLKLKRHFSYTAPRAQSHTAIQQQSTLPVASKVLPHTTE